MKKYPFISIAFLLFFSCNTKNELHNIIATDIKTAIPSHWVYFPNSFLVIDSFMSSVYDTEQYKTLAIQKSAYDSIYIADSISKEEAKTSSNNFIWTDDHFSLMRFGMTAKEVKEKSNKILAEMNELKRKYKPHLIGKAVFHDYKCTTDFGDSLYISMYVLDNSNNILYKKRFEEFNDRDIELFYSPLHN